MSQAVDEYLRRRAAGESAAVITNDMTRRDLEGVRNYIEPADVAIEHLTLDDGATVCSVRIQRGDGWIATYAMVHADDLCATNLEHFTCRDGDTDVLWTQPGVATIEVDA